MEEVAIYSAPGRSEVGGNHTDHQHGEILAASINRDAIAITKPMKDNMVRIISEDYEEIVIDLDQFSNGNIKQQNISLALAFSEYFLGKNGVCRVHGG